MNKNESLYRKTYEKFENLSSYAVQFRTKEMEKIFYSPWKKKCCLSPSEFSKAPPCYWLAISDVQNIWNFLSPCKKIPYITRSTHVVEFFPDCLTDFSPALYNPNSMIELPPNCPYFSPHLSWVIARGRGKHQDDRTIFPC